MVRCGIGAKLQVRLSKSNTKKVRIIAAELEQSVPSAVNDMIEVINVENNGHGVVRITANARKRVSRYKDANK